LLLAQGIGRWGNWFNQELFGKPTQLPWGLKIDDQHWPTPYSAANPPSTVHGDYATFHPTFLYECLWNLGAMGFVLWLDRRLRLGFGRCFALYVMAYTAGRAWIEDLRIDNVEYHDVLGLRLNVWTSIVVFALAATYFVLAGRRHRRPDTREESVYRDGRPPVGSAGAGVPEAGLPGAGVPGAGVPGDAAVLGGAGSGASPAVDEPAGPPTDAARPGP
jgi:prolipoprotein diacylglyceryl transferase